MSDDAPDFQQLIEQMDPSVHMNLKTAVELGRWPNGERLSSEQIEWCLQAIIAYEHRHLPAHERIGHIDRSGLGAGSCDRSGEQARPLKWQEGD